MKDIWVQTKNLFKPILDERDNYSETPDEYCERIQKILPDFPDDVLKQYFYQHWRHVDDYAWLEFESLSFKLESWRSDMVANLGIKDNPTVQTDLRHLENGNHYPRQQRIVEYFTSNGTWPLAPIMLENLDGSIKRPDGYQLLKPYHLIEGHHRSAIFLNFFEQKKAIDKHDVWVVRI